MIGMLQSNEYGLLRWKQTAYAFRPLHESDGVWSEEEILDAEGESGLFAVYAVHVQMEKEFVVRQAVFLHYSERGTCDRFHDSQPAGHASAQNGLARAKVAVQGYGVAELKAGCEQPAQFQSVLFRFAVEHRINQ